MRDRALASEPYPSSWTPTFPLSTQARRHLDHNSIVAEVTQQLSSRFNPNPQARADRGLLLVPGRQNKCSVSWNLCVSPCPHRAPFTQRAQVIKKRIESLIERDFIERDASDRSMYRYVA